MNDVTESTRKEAALAYFKVLSKYLLLRIKENHKKALTMAGLRVGTSRTRNASAKPSITKIASCVTFREEHLFRNQRLSKSLGNVSRLVPTLQ
jgi:hypothetical protein